MIGEVERTIQDKVVFFPEQIKWLEKMFPQRVLPLTASESEMRDYFGAQRVIETIRQRPSR